MRRLVISLESTNQFLFFIFPIGQNFLNHVLEVGEVSGQKNLLRTPFLPLSASSIIFMTSSLLGLWPRTRMMLLCTNQVVSQLVCTDEPVPILVDAVE